MTHGEYHRLRTQAFEQELAAQSADDRTFAWVAGIPALAATWQVLSFRIAGNASPHLTEFYEVRWVIGELGDKETVRWADGRVCPGVAAALDYLRDVKVPAGVVPQINLSAEEWDQIPGPGVDGISYEASIWTGPFFWEGRVRFFKADQLFYDLKAALSDCWQAPQPG